MKQLDDMEANYTTGWVPQKTVIFVSFLFWEKSKKIQSFKKSFVFFPPHSTLFKINIYLNLSKFEIISQFYFIEMKFKKNKKYFFVEN